MSMAVFACLSSASSSSFSSASNSCYAVAVGTSTGQLKLFRLTLSSHTSSNLTFVTSIALDSPVLSLAALQVPSSSNSTAGSDSFLLFAGTNDGRVTAWDLTAPLLHASIASSPPPAPPPGIRQLLSVALHQCGVNALLCTRSTARSASDSAGTAASAPPPYLLLSGSDDQSIGVIHFDVAVRPASTASTSSTAPITILTSIAPRLWSNAHAASITALCLLPPVPSSAALCCCFGSVSHDQRMQIWAVGFDPPSLTLCSSVGFELSDPASICLARSRNASSASAAATAEAYDLVVAGQGIQRFSITANTNISPKRASKAD
jgi:hypothetical protein